VLRHRLSPSVCASDFTRELAILAEGQPMCVLAMCPAARPVVPHRCAGWPVSGRCHLGAPRFQHIGGRLLELLTHPDPDTQTAQLRGLGRHPGSLSAECLAGATELDGRCSEPYEQVIIDAREDR